MKSDEQESKSPLISNYKPSKKDLKLLSYCLNELGLKVSVMVRNRFPDKPKHKWEWQYMLVGEYKGQKELYQVAWDDKTLGHATILAYRYFYRNVYATGKLKLQIIEEKEPEPEIVNKTVNKNPLSGLQNKMFNILL